MTSTWPHPRYAVAPPARIASTHVVAQPSRPFFGFKLHLGCFVSTKTHSFTGGKNRGSNLWIGPWQSAKAASCNIPHLWLHLVTEVFTKNAMNQALSMELSPPGVLLNGKLSHSQFHCILAYVCWQCKKQHLPDTSTSQRPRASRHVFFFLGLSASL